MQLGVTRLIMWSCLVSNVLSTFYSVCSREHVAALHLRSYQLSITIYPPSVVAGALVGDPTNPSGSSVEHSVCLP